MKVTRVFGLLMVLVALGLLGSGAIPQTMVQAADPRLAPSTAAHTLNLDGVGDFVRIPNQADLNPSSAITIEAWVRRADATRCETVLGKNHVSGYWLGFCSQRVRYYTNGSGTARDGVHTVPANEWTHIAVTFDGVTRRYYINGMLDYESVTPGPLPSNTDDLGIGANPDGSYPFRGNLADLRIWNIARSQTDIRRDMVRVLWSVPSGLAALWHLQGNAQDYLGTHDGSLRGDANFTGPAAPPVSHDPILIPRLHASPALDGVCSSSEYSLPRLPIWYGDIWAINNLAWAYVGATETDLYVCLENLFYGANTNQFATLYLDPEGDAGPIPQATDVRMNVQWPNGATWSEHGNGSGSYEQPGLSDYAVATQDGGFTWSAEFRIGRGIMLPRHASFRMQFMHHWVSAFQDDYGWPVDFDWNTPDAWPRFRFNDVDIPADFDVQVQAVEVTQGIRQNIPTRVPPNGDTVLIPDRNFQTHVANRRTIVRVYPWVQKRSDGSIPPLTAALYGYDNSGHALPGSPLAPQNATVYPHPDRELSALRQEAARSWNFVLPASWTAAGRIRLDAVANPPGPYFAPECDGCGDDNSVTLLGVQFEAVSPVTFIPTVLRWLNREDDGSITPVTPNLLELANAFAYVNKTWPVADLRIRRLHVASAACAVNTTDCRDPYSQGSDSPQAHQRAEITRYGVSPGDPVLFPALYSPEARTLQNNPARGDFLARIGCAGNAGVPNPDYWGGDCGATLAHESGHAGPARNHAGGVHGSIGAVDASYPDPHGGIEPDAYGFDLFAMQAIPPVGSTTHTHDFMSYGREELVWTSRYTWEGIRTWLSSVAAAQAQGTPATAQSPAQKGTPYLQVSGQIMASAARIDPAFQVALPAGAGDDEGQGSYELVLLDEAGATLFVRRFEPEILHSHWDYESGEVMVFTQNVPLKPGVAQILLRRDGQVLASRKASPTAPTLILLAPSPGAAWPANGQATVSWVASDDDPLSYRVEGSPDGGATWTLFGGSEGGSSAAIDLAGLPAAGGGWSIRLQASDGLNVSTAEVHPITIAAKAPQVLITNPRYGASASQTQEIVLAGQGFDWLDGQLADSQLTWQVDGQTIGKGAQRSISGLTVGPHSLTLQARNSSGLQSSATVTITVATDIDFDGLPDAWERTYGFDPQTPNASEDPDGDRLANWQELVEGTNPLAADSDGDGFGDKDEINDASDPLDPQSKPDLNRTLFLPMITHPGK